MGSRSFGGCDLLEVGRRFACRERSFLAISDRRGPKQDEALRNPVRLVGGSNAGICRHARIVDKGNNCRYHSHTAWRQDSVCTFVVVFTLVDTLTWKNSKSVPR